jgi:polyribonucleotide nucleotidyltransferase
MPYGAFVEFMPGKEGLLHISEMEWKRLDSVEETGLKEGDPITVKLLDVDPKTGKFRLSRRVLLPKPEGYIEPERPPRPPRPEGGDRRDDRRRNDRGGDRRDDRNRRR